MKSEFACKDGCRYVLKVEFSPEEVAEERAKVVGEYRKYARVAGFRPGKVPAALVEKKYAKEIAAAVEESLLPKGYREAKKEHGFSSLADMNLQKGAVKAGEGWEFSLEMDVEPKVELPAYKGIALEAKKVDIQEEAVDEQVKRLLEREGKFEEVAGEATVEEGDMAQVDFEATVDGRALAEFDEKAKSLGEAKGFWAMTQDEFSFLPGFGPALKGMKTGETKEIEVTFPEDFRIEALKGKKAVYKTVLKGVKRHVAAVLDEALLKRIGLKDEAELRDAVKKNLEGHAKADRMAEKVGEVRKFLVAGTLFALPQSRVATVENRMVYETVLGTSRRGVPEEEIKGHLEEIQKECHARAEESVKYDLVLDAIAKAEGLEVSRAEVMSELRRETGDAQKALKKAAKDNRCSEEDILESYTDGLRRDKVQRWLLKNAAWSGDGAEQMKLETAEA